MIRHMASIGEIVDDMAAAVAFYRDVLGLEVEWNEGTGYATAKVAGAMHFGIWSREAAAEATLGDKEAASRIPLGFTVEFEVDEVQAAAEYPGEQGVEGTAGTPDGGLGTDHKPLPIAERGALRRSGDPLGPGALRELACPKPVSLEARQAQAPHGRGGRMHNGRQDRDIERAKRMAAGRRKPNA